MASRPDPTMADAIVSPGAASIVSPSNVKRMEGAGPILGMADG